MLMYSGGLQSEHIPECRKEPNNALEWPIETTLSNKKIWFYTEPLVQNIILIKVVPGKKKEHIEISIKLRKKERKEERKKEREKERW